MLRMLTLSKRMVNTLGVV